MTISHNKAFQFWALLAKCRVSTLDSPICEQRCSQKDEKHNLEVAQMKSLVQAVVIAAALAAPVAAFAQSNQPVTRAKVRADLVQIEKAGYRPGDGDNTSYPAQVQAAEAKIAAQETSGVGGVAGGSTDTGRRGVSAADWNAMYNRS
jgi:hypothetical protein